MVVFKDDIVNFSCFYTNYSFYDLLERKEKNENKIEIKIRKKIKNNERKRNERKQITEKI